MCPFGMKSTCAVSYCYLRPAIFLRIVEKGTVFEKKKVIEQKIGFDLLCNVCQKHSHSLAVFEIRKYQL